MQSNLHRPERQPGETKDQYRARERASRYVATLGREVETGNPIRLTGLGDQHKAASSRQRLRDSQRQNGRGPKGVFGAGIAAAAAKARRDSNEHLAKHPRRDENGAYTVIGSSRRMWRAGISAQRGY